MTTASSSSSSRTHFQAPTIPSAGKPPILIDKNTSENQLYDRILLEMTGGSISPDAGAKTIAERLVQQVRAYEASPTRQQARLLRVGMRAIDQLRSKTFYSKGSDSDRKMQQCILETSKMVIACLVRKGHRCETEMYLKFGFLREAYDLLKNGKPPIAQLLSKDLLSSLVPLACAENNDDILLAFAEEGVCMKELPVDVQLRLARRAVEGMQDKALHRLVSDGCPLHDDNGNSQLFLSAVSSHLIEGVTAMLSRHVNVHSHDERGNTALHRAFFLGSLAMIRLLQHHIDPRAKNADGHTPLQALLTAKEHNADFLQLKAEAHHSFLQRLLERPPTGFQGVFEGSETVKRHLTRLGGASIFPPPGDIIEIAFLLNDKAFFFDLLAEISEEDFHQSCQELHVKYPKESVDELAFSHLQLQERHFATGCTHFEPPTRDPATNPPLEHLLTLFDRINFMNPKGERYIDPVAYLKAAREKDPHIPSAREAHAVLRGDLVTFITRFTSREHFYGAPVEGKPGFIEFFEQLTRMVKHIIAALEQKNDLEETQRALHEMISASLLCGGRYQETVLREYLKVCFGVHDEKPEETILKSLAELRFDLFEATIARIPENDAHDFIDAQHNLGAQLGIPGFKQVAHFQDPYSRIHRHDKRIEDEFREKYTPHAIVSYLIQTMENDARIRDAYLALHKTHGASTWKLDHYSPILKELACIEASDDREEREVRLISLFDYYSIMKSPGQSNTEAVLEDQKSDYLQNSVYNEEGHLRPHGVEFLLERLGVFLSVFPKKPEHPLPSAAPAAQRPPADGNEALSPGDLAHIPIELMGEDFLL
jgi:hypothetical protein